MVSAISSRYRWFNLLCKHSITIKTTPLSLLPKKFLKSLISIPYTNSFCVELSLQFKAFFMDDTHFSIILERYDIVFSLNKTHNGIGGVV